MASPGVLLSLDQADDVVHPQHQVPHHAEEAELVSRVHQLQPATFSCFQQVLPGLQHLRGRQAEQDVKAPEASTIDRAAAKRG